MANKLTVRTIETLALPKTRREVPDGLVNGLYLVVQPSGARSWAIRYRNAAGTPRKQTLGTYPAIKLASAREVAQGFLVEVAKGNDPAAEKKAAKAGEKAAKAGEKAAKAGEKAASDRDLVEQVVDQFVERYARANQRSWEETKRILDREVVKPWRGRHLAAVGRADVHDLLDAIVDRGSPIMANRTLAAFRKLCNWAVDRDLIAASPCDKLKAPSAENSRDRVLSDDELRRLWTACDGIGWPFGPLVRLLVLTGQRRDEVGEMRWSELDLDAGLWTLPRERAKNNQAHVVALSAPALAILRALPRIDGSDLVFTTNSRSAVSGFGKAKERLDAALGEAMPAWVIHDLRRSFASGLARLGVALPTIERALNHVSGSFKGVAGVYNRHDFGPERKHAFDAWGAHVERLMAEPGGIVVAMRAAS